MDASGFGLLMMAIAVVAIIAYSAVVGWQAQNSRRFRHRMDALRELDEDGAAGSVIRARYLRELPPWERSLEELPGMPLLARRVEQAGRVVPAYRVAFLSLGLALVGGVVAGLSTSSVWVGLIAASLLVTVPYFKLTLERGERLDLFEEQLPDALDMMTRSLRAGNPMLESLKFVADEMRPPISTEFGRTWSHINYGVSLKGSLHDLVERSPCVSLRSMVTALLVQRQTGGNLAEVLDRITDLLRQRARFQRRLRTLTAEGRMSAMVLGLMPFGLAGLLTLSSPTYLPVMFQDPLGIKMVTFACVLMALGLLWISRIVKVQV